MPTPPRPLPAGLGSPFATRAALENGVTKGRLRARDLETPFRGVRTVITEDQEDDEDPGPLARDAASRRDVLRSADAYDQVMADHAFFVGRTAAALHGLPIEHGDELEVGVTAPHRAPRRVGIRGRQVRSGLLRLTEVDGLRVTDPASTWASLAASLSVRELIVVGDAIVRVPRDDIGRLHPELALGTRDQLQHAIDVGRRPGREKLRAAHARIKIGSASPLETEYRLDAEDAGLPEPELDVRVLGRGGRLLGVSELVYRAFRLVVEIEGDHHRTSQAQWDRDIEKYRSYVAAGLEVVRLTARHIRGRNPQATSIVREALVRRGWRP